MWRDSARCFTCLSRFATPTRLFSLLTSPTPLRTIINTSYRYTASSHLNLQVTSYGKGPKHRYGLRRLADPWTRVELDELSEHCPAEQLSNIDVNIDGARSECQQCLG